SGARTGRRIREISCAWSPSGRCRSEVRTYDGDATPRQSDLSIWDVTASPCLRVGRRRRAMGARRAQSTSPSSTRRANTPRRWSWPRVCGTAQGRGAADVAESVGTTSRSGPGSSRTAIVWRRPGLAGSMDGAHDLVRDLGAGPLLRAGREIVRTGGRERATPPEARTRLAGIRASRPAAGEPVAVRRRHGGGAGARSSPAPLRWPVGRPARPDVAHATAGPVPAGRFVLDLPSLPWARPSARRGTPTHADARRRRGARHGDPARHHGAHYICRASVGARTPFPPRPTAIRLP